MFLCFITRRVGIGCKNESQRRRTRTDWRRTAILTIFRASLSTYSASAPWAPVPSHGCCPERFLPCDWLTDWPLTINGMTNRSVCGYQLYIGHCWRSRDELIRDVLLWIPTHGRAKAGRPARTYIQQLCEDTGCCPEDLPRAMNDREEWRERVRDIRAASTIWWWWYISP